MLKGHKNWCYKTLRNFPSSFLVFISISVFLKPVGIEDVFLLNLLLNGSNEQQAEEFIKLVQGYL